MVTKSNENHDMKLERLAYTKRESAQALGVPESVIDDLIRLGRLIPVKLSPRRTLIAKRDLVNLIETNRQAK